MPVDSGRVEEIFTEAVLMALPPQRAALLERACGGDAELRARVEALLAAHERGGAVLRLPAEPLSESVGTTIGRYKLLEQIGEGGFGVVFMAEQEHPVRRRVALKVIKLGMDTRQVVARFEAERQALAMMEHEHIARVFDAAATETGRPYFVMELVRGVPITTYCDENKLNTRQRLNLFIAVCLAVQHAHQKGVIHRDLKPNNVLVTMHDDRPVPKVIDFGVAKATQSRLTDRTLFTEFRQMIGTPAYMSPEQAQMSGLDVDTRSDIYSLGVLLYELLTGTTPFDTKQLQAASFDQMQRLICDTEPPRPSTRLGTLDVERQLTTAGARGTDPRRLTQSVRGDLDWIVMKCLEKDRNRRYETANALCTDVQRYPADEPVQARPPSPGYRFRKFARRNKGILTGGAAVVAALLVGIAASTWQAVRATRFARAETAALALAQANERAANENAAKAEAARQRAEQSFREVRLALKWVLADAVAGDGKWAAVPLTARKVLAEDAMRFYLKFVNETDPEPAIRFETASSLRAIALMRARVGEVELAEKTYRQSIEILSRLLVQFPSDREYQAQFALAHRLLANFLLELDRVEEAAESYRTAAKRCEGLLDESFNPDHLQELAFCYFDLMSIDPSPQNVQSLSTSILRRFEKSGLEQAQSRYDAGKRDNANALNMIAFLLVNVPEPAQRRPLRAIEVARKATELNPRFHNGWNTLGIAYYRAGNWKAAVAALEKSVSLWIGEDPWDRFFLAMAHWQLGNEEESRRQYDLGVAAIEQLPAGKRELWPVRAEAAELLGIPQTQPATGPATRP